MQISGEDIVAGVKARGLHAEEWMTGGGCLTVFASRTEPPASDIRDLWGHIAVGPSTGQVYDPEVELYAGLGDPDRDEYEESMVTFAKDATLEDVVNEIVSLVEAWS